jgi:hypothetical protein
MELTKQMNEFGLPLSFHTNKEVGLRLLSYGQCLVVPIKINALEYGLSVQGMASEK